MQFAIFCDGVLFEAQDAQAAVPWWSYTKTVLATAALILVAQKRLSLDTPLDHEHLGLDTPFEGQPLTLRQLLGHRAGLGDYGSLASYHAAIARAEKPWSPQEFLQHTQATQLRYPPGQGWSYSNIGYMYVRMLIEQTCAQSLESALRRLVFAPLGLQQTGLLTTPEAFAAVVKDGSDYHPGWVAHGLIAGPLTEAARLLHQLMCGALLPVELLQAMTEAHPLEVSTTGRPWHTPGYGLGLMTGKLTSGRACLGHTGAGPGSALAVYHAPNHATKATLAVSATREDQGAVEHELARLLQRHAPYGTR